MYAGPHLVNKDLALAYDFSSPRSWVSDSSTVYDLTGNNNNATVNGSPATGAANGFQLTYMEFDGTDDYLQITANDATLDFQEGQTLGFVFYHSYTSGRRNLWDQAYGGYGTWTHESGNQISYYYGSNGGNSTPYKGFNTGNIPNDQWDYVVTSRFEGGAKSYLNGVELAPPQTQSYYIIPLIIRYIACIKSFIRGTITSITSIIITNLISTFMGPSTITSICLIP
jgi:hypothetical protein